MERKSDEHLRFRVGSNIYELNIRPEIEEFQINEFLSVKLEDDECVIYVNGKPFNQCSYILISVPKIDANIDLDCIDQFAEHYSTEHEKVKEIIDKRTELFAHASNLQAWYEHDYDTRILHSNLSFPLLKKLAAEGDLLARKVFKDEVVVRIASGYENVIIFLLKEDYLDIFSKEEFLLLFEENKKYFPKSLWVWLIKYLYKYDKILMCFLLQGLAVNLMIKGRIFKRAVIQEYILDKDAPNFLGKKYVRKSQVDIRKASHALQNGIWGTTRHSHTSTQWSMLDRSLRWSAYDIQSHKAACKALINTIKTTIGGWKKRA